MIAEYNHISSTFFNNTGERELQSCRGLFESHKIKRYKGKTIIQIKMLRLLWSSRCLLTVYVLNKLFERRIFAQGPSAANSQTQIVHLNPTLRSGWRCSCCPTGPSLNVNHRQSSSFYMALAQSLADKTLDQQYDNLCPSFAFYCSTARPAAVLTARNSLSGSIHS